MLISAVPPFLGDILSSAHEAKCLAILYKQVLNIQFAVEFLLPNLRFCLCDMKKKSGKSLSFLKDNVFRSNCPIRKKMKLIY